MYSGLTKEQVEEQVSRGHVNRQDNEHVRTKKEIIQENVFTYFNLINTVLFVLVLITGRISNAFFYVTIVFNALIGIYQELRAKELLDQMSIMVRAKVDVCRDGKWDSVYVDEIVLGDLIRIRSGAQVPADGTLVSGYLEVNESMLTGESLVVPKQAGSTVFSGTLVTAGEALIQVNQVGEACAASKIMKEARKYTRAKSMLQEDMNKLLRIISVAIIPTGIILFAVQYGWIGLPWRDAVLKTISAMVGMIPEGLVVLTSMALAISTIRLAQQKVLIQDLFAIECLARVDTLCLDKTGTLTQGSMEVTDVVPLLDYSMDQVNAVMGSYLHYDQEGNATDTALKEYFRESHAFERQEELPFSSDRKYAGVRFVSGGTYYLGALNFLFPDGCPAANKFAEKFEADGSRILVLAHSVSDVLAVSRVLPADLEPVALVAIHDILRTNVKEIMQYFTNQEVNLKVISGDDARTVSALAVQAGIPGGQDYVDMSQTAENYDDLVENYNVFGRVLPDQKQKLVEAMQRNGHTVAMTGDGVNDVPAFKSADISIAMAAGSSAAKNAANIVLLNDDFGMMPKIVDEGRRVINNISRASSMYLVKTVFSMLLSIYAIVLQQEYPFLPIHLSVVSSLCVGIPTFILQMEPSFERVKQSRFFTRAFRNAVPSSVTVLVTALVCLAVKEIFALPVENYYLILVCLTMFIYFYTLYRVYYPPTKLRIAVLAVMGFLAVLVLYYLAPYLQVSFDWKNLAVIVPLMWLIPYNIRFLGRVYDHIGCKVSKRYAKEYGL